MIVKQEAAMKKMCLVVLTALIIIICVIAFKRFTEAKEESFDGILIEKNTGREYDNYILLQEFFRNGGTL